MTKINVEDEHDSAPPIRFTKRKPKGRKAERILVRCGCCDERLEIYPSDNPFKLGCNPSASTIEIGGVSATVDQWRKVLGPLLGLVPPQLSDVSESGHS